MNLIYRLRALFRNWRRRRQIERDLKDELQAYADLVADEHRARGMNNEAAARQGRLALGGVEPTAEAVRASRTGAGIERFVQDVRYTLRHMRRSPGFAAMAMLTIGLGIGVTTTLFGIVDAALFKPLPYRDPDQLVDIAYVRGRGTASEARYIGLSWAQVDQWRAEAALFEGIEVYGHPRAVKEIDGSSVALATVGRLPPSIFDLLGVSPSLGRTFTDADMVLGSAALLLSDEYWGRAFGADRDVLGRVIAIDGHPHTIVGVMPPTFRWRVGRSGFTIGWTPLDERAERTSNPQKWNTGEIIRLRKGLTVETAERELDAVALRLQASVPAETRWDVDFVPIDSRRQYFGELRLMLFLFLGASGILLLIPCTNVAGLLLARGVRRRGELAIRSALGATRVRLVTQLVTEGLVLASLGGVAAVFFAWWSTSVIPVLLPVRLPLFDGNPLQMDGRVVAYCIGMVVIATLLCSLIPALRQSRRQAADLAGGTRRATGVEGHRRLHRWLQGAQVAFVLVLLCGHTLLASSFIRMVTTHPGYDVEGLARIVISLPTDRYSMHRSTEFFDDLLHRVTRIPGVTAATLGHSPIGDLRSRVFAEGREGSSLLVYSYHTASDYFDVVGIPLTNGRPFLSSDTSTSPPVAIISEGLARAIWPDETPLGRQIRHSEDEPWITVVGVVGDITTAGFIERTPPFQLYHPLAQQKDEWASTYGSFVVRTSGDPNAIGARIAEATVSMEPSAEITNHGHVADAYATVREMPRLYLIVMTIMAGLALATATVGLHASASYAVNQRRREIGIRLTLGADPRMIQRAVLRDALQPVLIGAAIGLVAAYWLTQFLTAMLYDVTPGDPIAMIAAVAVLLIAAFTGTIVPARRAARVDPAVTLRAE